MCLAVFLSIRGTLDSIHAADRYRGDNEMRFAQIAAFLPVDGGKAEEDIFLFREVLNQKLVVCLSGGA